MRILEFAWLLFVAAAPQPAGQTPRQVAHKRCHLARVTAELSQRDVAQLDSAQRARRRATLAALRAYAVRGRFPVNTDFPGWEVPYFIDREGTRCALARLIDESGEGALVQRLARSNNHAYVASLVSDGGLVSWLARHGLTLDEAAFIQGPGFSSGGRLPPPETGDDEPERRGPPPVTRPRPAGGPALDGGQDTENAPGGIEEPTAGKDAEALRPRRTRTSPAADWQQWWDLNRDAYVNLRERYHARLKLLAGAGGKTLRPQADEISREIMPVLRRLGAKGDVRATALMAWARVGSAKERAEAVGAILAFLGDGQSLHREYGLLALGATRDEGAFDPLVDVMLDLPQGRKVLGKVSPVGESMRALAAIGLGALGDGDAIEHLIAVLGKDGKDADLKTAAVASLGLLAGHGPAKVRAFLEQALKDEAWPRPALAAIPVALARAGGLDVVVERVARFRDPVEVRQSCALAIGLAAPRLTLPLVETLEAAALRDTDPLVRRFAAMALAEVALRDRETIGIEAKDRAFRFFRGALRGINTQATDRPWHALAAALFAKRFEELAPVIEERLVRAARKDSSPEGRAAAALALGLCGRADALARTKSKDARQTAFRAEARGLAGDRSALEELLGLATKHASEEVRLHAAFGLGLLGEPTVLGPLLDALAKERSQPAQAALTRILGAIGDRTAVAPLLELAKTSTDVWTRRRALAALGVLADPRDRGWNYEFRRAWNFASMTPALALALSLF